MTFTEFLYLENKNLLRDLEASKERLRFWQLKVEFLEKQYSEIRNNPPRAES